LLVSEGRITALLDWELAHLGHPLDDLGAAVWACLDVLDPAEVVDAYQAASGGPVDERTLDWFLVLACVSRSVMLLAGVSAFVEGRSSLPTLAALGLELMAANLELAAETAWGTAPSPPPELAPDAGPPPWARPTPAEIALGLARYLGEEALGRGDDAR